MKKLIYVVLPLIISILIFICTLTLHTPINTIKQTEQKGNQSIVIIDAGHGGFDGGAVANDGTIEKDINLSIALFLYEYLSFFNIETIMIRDSDCSIEDDGLNTIREKKSSDLHNRMKVMEETDNAIFVSIHQNKYTDAIYSGTQVFYSPKTKDESQILAQTIQDYIVNTLQNDNTRQIKECGTSVFLMYNAVKPAVLVECGFLSNYEETQRLKSSEYQKKIAFCIAMGIQNYLSVRS